MFAMKTLSSMRSRTLLRWLLLAQGIAAAVIAYAAARYAGVQSLWLALAAGVGSVLAVRLLITFNNFAISARFASPTPDDYRMVGMRARLGLFFEEFMATMLNSSWFMTFNSAREQIYPDCAQPPLLLLHGYGCNAGYWSQLVARLDAARISHAALDLEPILADIDDYVPLVQGAVDSLCRHSGARQVVIVAHSMGGLVARAYIRAHGLKQVAHVFTLGTPHHGTSLASFGPGRNAMQMRRGAMASDWLQALAASESAATRAKITSIFTHHDNIVAPQTSSFLPGSHNIEFGGIGHVALGGNPRILDRLLQEITKLTAR